MIRPLRQRHRRLFAVLVVALPVAFVGGIAARRPVPTSALFPGSISGEPRRFTAIQWSRGDLFTKAPIRVTLIREQAGSGRFAVELSATKDFAKPDLLVYWIAGGSTVSNAIPENAVLLAGFNESIRLPLPTVGPAANGMLILYSLADHEVVDVSKPIPF
jgi:hypothetical protein